VTVGTMWVIDEGLKPGEQVAVEGLQRLRDGTPVTPKLAQLSPAQLSPAHLPTEGH
jgi:membrane fusion protein (multidrug efflux system)